MKVLALICLAVAIGNVAAFQSCTTGSFPDLVLVVEDSDKLDSSSELQLRSFLAEIANNFNLEQDSSRVAYQQYNNTNRHVFYLNTYDETNDARSTILTTAFTRTYDGIPIIANALDDTWTTMLTVTNGERSCHPTVVVLVSYSSYDDPNGGLGDPDPYLIAKDLTAVRQLKNSGALIITVGVGPKRNPKHLLELASGPDYYHDYATFDLLTGTEADNIAVQACAYVPDGNFYPCEMKVVQSDFVFVVDVSENFAKHAPDWINAVVDFMNNTLTPYNFDHVTGVQAALVTYQKDADIQINFNDHDDLASFLSDANTALTRSCGMYTDRCVEDALDKITNHVFVPSTGYRQTCTIHQIYVFVSECFNCGDPVPLATILRTDDRFPNTEIFVIPLAYGVTSTGFWKEYLEIADDAAHLWEAQPDPIPIVTEYLHKQAWRGVCRSFATAECQLTSRAPPVSAAGTTPPATPPITTIAT